MTTISKADLQRAIHGYRQEHKVHEVDLRKVAEWAHRKLGMKLPEPVDPLDQLTAKFARAAREETRVDPKTRRPYRVNHAFPVQQGDKQLMLWVDIDHASRKQMHISLQKRRDQTLGDVLQMTFDADYWNSINESEDPLVIVKDFTDDVEERKAADSDGDDKAAE